ncbi:hypothetical protein F6455_10520 [Proteobacteria bacterium 005FR1]|nr:hypothetical protein [Proteobacteria bacterium 005FR1]
MSVLLFRLNNVPEEEADAVRALLEEHDVDYYETSAGKFGISVAGIWLRDDSQLPRVRRLLDEFQMEHSTRMRQSWQESIERGEADTFLRRMRREPLKIILFLAVIALILYVSTVPWLNL